MEANMKKIITLAAVLLIGGALGGPAAFAQATGQQNSGAGVVGLPGNKSGPAVMPPLINPGQQFSGYRQDQGKVPGLPGNKSGPALQPPTGLQDLAQNSEEQDEDQDGLFRHHPGMMEMGGHGYGHHDWHQGRGLVAPRIIFSLMDADGDGKLTLEEWQAAQQRIFKAMDTDHDGTVTFEEMQAFMRGH
jgi:hypothetical protein